MESGRHSPDHLHTDTVVGSRRSPKIEDLPWMFGKCLSLPLLINCNQIYSRLLVLLSDFNRRMLPLKKNFCILIKGLPCHTIYPSIIIAAHTSHLSMGEGLLWLVHFGLFSITQPVVSSVQYLSS